ncbi:MAG: LPS export ABC transporter periplasmic protein LptC [Candidatus Omnitrophica bacterium]|nr:LPS export ABC transporter periplasmic protein LptC [Candidatus Omnitrophota bacterium]
MMIREKREFIFLFLLFYGCAPGGDRLMNSSEKNMGENSPPAIQRIEDFSLEGFKETGEKQWELEADYADVSEGWVKMEAVRARVLGEEGKIDLKSGKGEYDKEERKIYLSNNVVMETSEGTRLLTDKLAWDIQKEEAITDKEVVVERDNLTVAGKGALALPEIKKVELKENIEVKAEPRTLITCKGPLELDYEKNIARFYEEVKVEDEQGELLADRMEVFFQAQDKKIEKVFAYGGVQIIRGENIAYAEEAIYEAKEHKVILKGNPRLVIISAEGLK